MNSVPKTFWGQPLRYLRWASQEKPAIFWSVLIGSLGPVALLGIPPVRRRFGDEEPPRVPATYPVPTGKRNVPDGYDD